AVSRLACLLGAGAFGPVAQWLEPTAHSGLVAGPSPAGPTRIGLGRIAWERKLASLPPMDSSSAPIGPTPKVRRGGASSLFRKYSALIVTFGPSAIGWPIPVFAPWRRRC